MRWFVLVVVNWCALCVVDCWLFGVCWLSVFVVCCVSLLLLFVYVFVCLMLIVVVDCSFVVAVFGCSCLLSFVVHWCCV